MARKRLTDFLQDHLFWAFDATSDKGFPVFNPLFGFSRITAPEIALEVDQFKDGTFLYNRSVVKGGQVSPVLFERAASMFDSDFYEWIIHALHGNKDFLQGSSVGKIANALVTGGRTTPRRNLLILQFTRINVGGLAGGTPTEAATIASVGIILGSTISSLFAGGGALGLGAVAGGALAGSVAGYGPFEFASRIPGRAWLLHNCLPMRYKAGSDFDASSGQVSLQELEVQPEYVEEFSLGVKP